jgi:hypothetical protein
MKKSPNQTIYAIWIDRKHAMVMKTTSAEEPAFVEIKSSAGIRERFNGETTNKTGMLGTSIAWQKKMQEKENNHVQQFLKKVLTEIQHAKEILILGSGDTRYELQNAIEKSKLHQGVPLKNRAFRKITRRELELEMEKEFSLHMD